jgi:hypothetical protein
MGGHIVVASLELRPGLYQGGLAECGLVDGIGIADYLMAYTAAAELIAGVPLLDTPDRQVFARLLNESAVPALGMPGSYTVRGRQFDSVVSVVTSVVVQEPQRPPDTAPDEGRTEETPWR